jgi:hypothetical protein
MADDLEIELERMSLWTKGATAARAGLTHYL